MQQSLSPLWLRRVERNAFLRGIPAGGRVAVIRWGQGFFTDGVDPFLASLPAEAVAAMDADAFLSRAMAYLRPEGHMDDRTAVVISTFE